eukprot:TRINITY_DN31357_c0_g2_i1.p1 TRINITY_DN31357_c0_g2~~TRINITY_DN31357_c0_g2_i1.p1  ORF type:complete len:124 (+),score=1.32 TRINITY_DN31357_c0_g2_i1:213-584(+)
MLASPTLSPPTFTQHTCTQRCVVVVSVTKYVCREEGEEDGCMCCYADGDDYEGRKERCRERDGGTDGPYYYCPHTSIHTTLCLLYTSDAADEEDSGDLGGRRLIKKKKHRLCTLRRRQTICKQ